MRKMLRKLIEYLPISRRKHAKSVEEINKVIAGLVESDANHCQIELSIIQQLEKKPLTQPSKSTKNDIDPSFQ